MHQKNWLQNLVCQTVAAVGISRKACSNKTNDIDACCVALKADCINKSNLEECYNFGIFLLRQRFSFIRHGDDPQYVFHIHRSISVGRIKTANGEQKKLPPRLQSCQIACCFMWHTIYIDAEDGLDLINVYLWGLFDGTINTLLLLALCSLKASLHTVFIWCSHIFLSLLLGTWVFKTAHIVANRAIHTENGAGVKRLTRTLADSYIHLTLESELRWKWTEKKYITLIFKIINQRAVLFFRRCTDCNRVHLSKMKTHEANSHCKKKRIRWN